MSPNVRRWRTAVISYHVLLLLPLQLRLLLLMRQLHLTK